LITNSYILHWEVSQIDRVKYLAEMKALLSFMSAEERLAVIRRYERQFDEAGREGELSLIRELGSPVRQVLMVEREYREREEAGLPGLAVEEAPVAEPQPEPAGGEVTLEAEAAAVMEKLLSEEAQEEFAPVVQAEISSEEEAEASAAYEEAESEVTETAEVGTGRVVGAVALTPVMIVLALVGLAVTAALAALGLLPGLGLGAAAVYLALYAMTAMNFLPDILLVWGVAVIALALCVFFLWLGVWLLVEGVSLTVRTISRVYGKVLRKGGAEHE